MPLHIIARYVLKLFWLIYSWLQSGGWKDRLDDAYWMGFNDGRKETDAHMNKLGRIIVDAYIGDSYGRRK